MTAVSDAAEDDAPRAAAQPCRKWAVRGVALVVLVGAITAALMLVDVKREAPRFVAWIERNKHTWWMPLAYAGVYVLSTMLLFPAVLLTLAAGFVYGLGVGFAIVSPTSTLAATVNFLLGRTLLRDVVQQRMLRYPKWTAIDAAVEERTAYVVLLLRLSPAVPYTILNYALGLTSAPTPVYVAASWVGMLPGTLLFVYLGTLLRSASDVASGHGTALWGPNSNRGTQILFVFGLVATVVVVVYVTVFARRAIREHLERIEGERQPLTATSNAEDDDDDDKRDGGDGRGDDCDDDDGAANASSSATSPTTAASPSL